MSDERLSAAKADDEVTQHNAATSQRKVSSLSLSSRFARALVVVVGVLLALFAVAAMMFASDRAEQALEDRLRTYLTIYETALGVPIIRGDSRAVQDYVTSIMRDPAVVYVNISTRDRVLITATEDEFDVEQLEDYVAKGTYAFGRVEVLHRRVEVGRFEIGLSRDSVDTLLLDNAVLIMAFTIAILLSIVVTTYLVFRRLVTRPVAALKASAGAIAGGNLKANIAVGGRDEVGELARGFDHMRQSVLGLIDDLSQANATLEDRVAERTAELGKANQLILDSIQYASRIQTAVLPTQTQFEDAAAVHFLIWEPRDVVGGDFAWVQKVKGGHILMVGDCTGHGVPGAFMTLIACSMIENIIDDARKISPAKILSQLDVKLRDMLGQDGAGNASTDDGLEGGVCFVPSDGSAITFAGARFSLFIAEPETDLREIKGDKAGVGHQSRGKPAATFTDQQITLTPGASLYMATDGIIDQIGGPKRLSFGKRRFTAELAKRATSPMAEQSQGLTQTLADYQGSEGRRDDVTVLGFRPNVKAQEG